MRSPLPSILLLAVFILAIAGGADAQSPYSAPGPIPTPAWSTSTGFDQAPPAAPAVEARGIWIEMKTLPASAEGIRKVVRQLARCNLNFLLLEVTYEGGTLFPGPFQDPRFRGLDPLAIAIDEAHKNKLELHVWFWTIKQGRWREEDPNPGGPVLAAHPDWMAINQMGVPVSPGSSYYWLCPSRPECRHFVVTQIEDVARRYAIDGVHLDYVRFDRTIVKGAPPPYCVCDHCRTTFQAAGGSDPMRISAYTPEFQQWMLWRENLVSTLVGEVSARVRAIRPSIVMSAAVYPDPTEARRYFGQNWALWLANRSLDFVSPMLYRDQTDTFVRRMQHYVQDGITVTGILLPGVGVNEIQNRIFSHDVLIEQVKAARQQGMLGNVLFSFSVMTPYFEQFLIDKVYVKPARVPFRDELDAVNRLVAQAQSLVGETTGGAQASWLMARARELEAVIRHRINAALPTVASDVPFSAATRFQPLPQISVPRMAAPVIDGGLNDAAWKSAAPLAVALNENGGWADAHSAARVGTDGRFLYVAVRCEDDDLPDAVARIHRNPRHPWSEDHVAVLLDPGPSRSQYLALRLSPVGRSALEKIPDGKKRPAGVGTPESVPDTLAWSGAVRRGAKGWTAEYRIPLGALMSLHPGGRALGFNVIRLHRSGTTVHYEEWVTSYGPPYDPMRFGTAALPQ
mgnify:CR=1 FL=1